MVLPALLDPMSRENRPGNSHVRSPATAERNPRTVSLRSNIRRLSLRVGLDDRRSTAKRLDQVRTIEDLVPPVGVVSDLRQQNTQGTWMTVVGRCALE